ncbi:hypothetical protein W911_05935 [Hyphomicrobium nitrativorans NL23]|uniref:DUF4166 domain-containing protein n=1 Tax=Hyphomicrobium nitrativorans NL23 TaxID=1029756 RepID=V5SDL5_9HYPH|nr:DUF4166 domain-containing protein [Hyphomicrobium nitrativorans]AHB48044.1 hypothetical protein W911_05935 [Hyphomicrobium nitrativorans NL23]
MTALQKEVPIVAAPAPAIAVLGTEVGVVDLRFRALVGEAGWARLPEAVQRRFSRRLASGDVAFYVGEVLETRLSRVGRVLSFLARAIGAPLPLDDATGGGATVAVMENAGLGGQSWTRTYARAGRFPQVIHSAKCFSGPTGLEEHVGGGVGMTLSVAEEGGALVFRSAGYFFSAGRIRLSLPRVLMPGDMEIVHEDEGGGAFLFKLTLRHGWLGVLVQQTARFRDA